MTKTPDPFTALASAMNLPDTAEAPEWVHLLPVTQGDIQTFDSRGPYRVLNAEEVIAESMANPRGIPIDENHATDLAAPLGGPAPARGWIVELQARDDGIWGRVEWTKEGRELVAGKSYRGLSPVLGLKADKRTLAAIKRASLVNVPNLRGLTALNQETPMNFMEKLAEALGLTAGASEEDILGAVASKSGTTALQSSLTEIGAVLGVEADQAKIVAAARQLKSGLPSEVVALQSELTALTTELNTIKEASRRDRATAFVDQAIKEGRVGVKQSRDRFISLHMERPEDTEQLITGMPILNGSTVLPAVPPAGDGKLSLNAEQRNAARLLGIPEDKYLATLESEKEKA